VSLPPLPRGDRCPSRGQSPRADPRQAPTLNQLLLVLNTDAQQRFNGLRRRCLEMRSIAPHDADPSTVDGTTDAWTPRLDRLLYGSCACSATRTACSGFLGFDHQPGADEAPRRSSQNAFADAEGLGRRRMTPSLEESTAIADQRLDNFRRPDEERPTSPPSSSTAWRRRSRR